jgi:hypothetical protein
VVEVRGWGLGVKVGFRVYGLVFKDSFRVEG